jgi:hypothetical protein
VNPRIKTIPEIYPGIEQESVRVGSDVYELYKVVDAIAHEYEYGGGDHTATARTQADWFFYQVGMHAFRAFAEGKATWILNYSWDGDKKLSPKDAMQNLAMSQVMAGANFWDAKGHNMSNSNDMPTRTKIFDWIRRNEAHLYHPRKSINPIGVYFSPKTRDYYSTDFIASFRGILILLMQQHWEFQVVTPRTLKQFTGKTLVLPDVRVLNSNEISALEEFVAKRGTLIATGENAATQLGNKVARVPKCPGKAYVEDLQRDFDTAVPNSQQEFLRALRHKPVVQIDAIPAVATSIASVDGKTHIYFANFSGLRSGENAVPTPLTNVRLQVHGRSSSTLHIVPFMGSESTIKGARQGDSVTFMIPRIERGTIAWIDNK